MFQDVWLVSNDVEAPYLQYSLPTQEDVFLNLVAFFMETHGSYLHFLSMVVRLIFRHIGEARSDYRQKEHTSLLLELCCTNELRTDEDERTSAPHCQIQKIETS